jgi:hypothetical protein
MKIKDIILREEKPPHKVGEVSQRFQQSSVGLIKFRDKQFADRVYELNRIMMAVASSDGVTPLPPNIDAESWAGRNDIAAPYTKEEQAMLKQAYDAIGSHYEDMNDGDTRSMELKSTYTDSPVAKPKRNKYGV